MAGIPRLGPDGKIGKTEVPHQLFLSLQLCCPITQKTQAAMQPATKKQAAFNDDKTDKQLTFQHGVSTRVKLATNTLSTPVNGISALVLYSGY